MTTNLRTLARAGVRRLPPEAQERLRRVRDVLTPPRRPPDPRVGYAADVMDIAALRDFLSDTDIFGAAREECAGYLNDALERFRITISLVDRLLQRGSVLELGSNPYFITRLLRRRGLEVRCANWFGDDSIGPQGTQVSTAVRSGVRDVFEFDHFNVETDRFPYEDSSFDLVLCCEILEHLPHDPVHMLSEIHRVLRRDRGHLLLTTPNPVRLDNLSRMLDGANIYEELSGYGAYGRHNREYTVDELTRLLEECGYVDVRCFATDIHHHDLPDALRMSGANLRMRGDNIFAAGRAAGDQRWPYPRWLYSSRHALARIVRDDVRVGYNDALQSEGMHEIERDGSGEFRWTGAGVCTARVRAPANGAVRLVVEGLAPPAISGSRIGILAEVDGAVARWDLTCDDKPFALSAAVSLPSGEHVVSISTDRTWRPSYSATSDDSRDPGVRLTRIALER